VKNQGVRSAGEAKGVWSRVLSSSSIGFWPRCEHCDSCDKAVPDLPATFWKVKTRLAAPLISQFLEFRLLRKDCIENVLVVAKGCRTSWSRQSGGTPQVVGSIPGRDEFPPAGKKNPSPASCPKHYGTRPNSQGDGPLCTGGAGVRGFSWPVVRRSFYLSNNAVGAVLPPARQVFILYYYFIQVDTL